MAVVSNTLNSQPRPHVSPLGNFRNLQKKFMMPLCCILVAMMLYSTGGNTTGSVIGRSTPHHSSAFNLRLTSNVLSKTKALDPELPPAKLASVPNHIANQQQLVAFPKEGPMGSAMHSASESHKPAVPPEFYNLLMMFTPSQPRESCFTVQDDLLREDSIATIHLSNLVNTLFPSDNHSPDWTKRAEKDCESSMNGLHSSLFVSDNDMSNSLKNTNFLDRIIECHVDQENARGIIQSLIFYGLSTCVKSNFSQILFGGTASYVPSLQLDKKGNTLIHLAVLSGTSSMLKAVQHARNRMGRTEFMNTIIWMVSALMHRNSDGQTPQEIATLKHSGTQEIKQIFRSHTTYMKNFLNNVGPQPEDDKPTPVADEGKQGSAAEGG